MYSIVTLYLLIDSILSVFVVWYFSRFSRRSEKSKYVPKNVDYPNLSMILHLFAIRMQVIEFAK